MNKKNFVRTLVPMAPSPDVPVFNLWFMDKCFDWLIDWLQSCQKLTNHLLQKYIIKEIFDKQIKEDEEEVEEPLIGSLQPPGYKVIIFFRLFILD